MSYRSEKLMSLAGISVENKTIQELKSTYADIPVGHVDAYYEFENRPAITEACDVILADCYSFWEGCSAEYSLLYVKDMYRGAKKAANVKKVIITETGWIDKDTKFYRAEPSLRNALTYFINAQIWSKEVDIDIFYFSSFDEPWKVSTEGDVGSYWGLWDKNGKPKYE